MMKNKVYSLLAVICLFFTLSNIVEGKENMRLHGILVEEPCTILPDDESIHLDFSNIPDKTFYTYGRSVSEPFNIHLSECDTSIGKSLKITFYGDELASMPGYLAINSNSQASGIVIGIEKDDGSLLSLNKEDGDYLLKEGSTVLNFKAFIKGEKNAIANHQIERGPFNAIATFKLNYN